MSAPDDLIADRYRLVRLVGSGGMGAVWEARDERLGRPVALKLLHKQYGLAPADAELNNQRAMREARITARIHHRHAVPVFDVVEHEGRPCLVMQFLPSVPLSTLLKETGPLDPAEAAKVGAQVSSALAAAHTVGVVHRDVKPGNILVGDDDNVMISDFGISHAFGDATLTATGLVHGTPAFLAPEVARGAATTFASDVFSLGATLYAAVEGSPPFGTDPNTMALLHRVASGQFVAPERAGPLTDVIVAMLATDPQGRPTMKAVADAIAEIARSGAAAALPANEQPTIAATTRPLPSETPAGPPEPRTAVFGRDDATPLRPVPSATPPGPPASSGTARGNVVGPPAPPYRAPATPAAPPPGPEPRRRTGLIVAAVLVLLLIGVVTVVALTRDRFAEVADPGTSQSASTEPSTTEPASETPTRSAPSTPASASAEPTPSPTATPSATPSPTPSASPTTATAAELADAITSYYAVMPDDTDEGWTRLTTAYQANPSGGKKNYEDFWKEIEKVSVSNVVGRPPNQAEATVSYVFKDNDRPNSTERTTYGLVEVDGIWKINSSRVTGG